MIWGENEYAFAAWWLSLRSKDKFEKILTKIIARRLEGHPFSQHEKMAEIIDLVRTYRSRHDR